MMFAWSFAARTPDEVARLIRSLGKHRYVKEVDHRIHWAVDRALQGHPAFASHAAAFVAQQKRDPSLEPNSRDPRLWRPATTDEVIAALSIFWSADEAAEAAREGLLGALLAAGIEPPEHEPFEASPESPPFPELIELNWTLLPVEELDSERHAGALYALSDSGEEITPALPVYQEGPILASPELVLGAPNGVLDEDFIVWSEGPYPYADYVFRGVAKSAKLVDPPVGYRDI
ncbi:MAG: hypothetical protein U0359_38340 [Byssovorax sp.]